MKPIPPRKRCHDRKPKPTNNAEVVRLLKQVLRKVDHVLKKEERLLKKVGKLMTKEEFEQKQDELTDQLNKALAEILTAIQNSGTVPQEMVDKLQAAKDLAQQLDDLNPDQP